MNKIERDIKNKQKFNENSLIKGAKEQKFNSKISGKNVVINFNKT